MDMIKKYNNEEISSIISNQTTKDGKTFRVYFDEKEEYTIDEIVAIISNQTMLNGNDFKPYFID